MIRCAVGALLVALVMTVVSLDAPAVGAQTTAPTPGAPVAVTCDAAVSPFGIAVGWRTLGSDDADRFVFERSTDGEVFLWRGADDRSVGVFVDSDPELEGMDATYRVVHTRGGEVRSTTECSLGRGDLGGFECSVVADGGGYSIDWSGGPTGEGLDYVIERDVNPDDVFHWRGRTVERQFQDEGSRSLPVYRVIARFDNEPALSVECDLGVMATSSPEAAFVCPVSEAGFVDTFGADRDGGARLHQGVDMFADSGTPVFAPEDGVVELFSNGLGGKSFALYADSGTFYYGAHLDSFVGEDRIVVAGELVGTVGNTGNARTTPSHLHFQIHPDGRGTPAVNPTGATDTACR